MQGSIDPIFNFNSYISNDNQTWYSLQSSPRTDSIKGPYATGHKGNISLAVAHHIHMQRPALSMRNEHLTASFVHCNKCYNAI